MAQLDGKIVLISGAAGAIGSAVVAAVKQAGGVAIATDLKVRPGVEHALDVTAEADWARVTAEIARQHGRLDGLVNAAGIASVGHIENVEFAEWRRVLSINLDGTFLGCKHAFPLLRKQGGSIVNLASVLALIGGHNLTAYSASKGGVSLLSKSVALYGARFKPPVRCNAVCPAFVEGPMVDAIAQFARSGVSAASSWLEGDSARPHGQAGRDRRALRLSVVGRRGLHHRRRSADRRRTDGALAK